MDNHWGDQIGVVEKCWLDETERKLRAILRFSKSARGEEIFQDVLDNIRKNVSIGYLVDEIVLESEKDDVSTYRAKRWSLYEVSMAPIPADPKVGVGRSAEEVLGKEQIENKRAESKEEAAPVVIQINERNRQMDEQKRIEEIRSISERYGVAGDWAIVSGVSVEQFRAYALEQVANSRKADAVQNPPQMPDLGMSDKEVRQYSLLRAIRAMADGNKESAGFEMEVSRELEKRLGTRPSGLFVPIGVLDRQSAMQRDNSMTVGGATSGAKLVGTDHLAGEFIQYAYDKMVVLKLGGTLMTGLVGNVSVPKQTGKSTVYWPKEGGSATAQNISIGNLSLSPKQMAAITIASRKLVMQSAPSVEKLIKDDIYMGVMLGLDDAVYNGRGVVGSDYEEPTGLFNLAEDSGIGIIDGADLGWDKLVEFETKVATANLNAGTMAYVMNAATHGILKTREKVEGYPMFLADKGEANGYPVETTNIIPNAHIAFGDHSKIIIANWGVLDIMANPYNDDGSLKILSFLLADVGFRQNGAFSISKTVS